MFTIDAPTGSLPTASPAEVGFEEDRVADLLGRAGREIETGLLPSCQVAVAHEGRLVVWRTLGAAEPGSRYLVYSVTKGLMAAATWLAIGEGGLERSTRVAAVIPEFAANGKDAVTVEHLLTHTAGFPHAPFGPTDWDDRELRLARFSSWRLDWEPGTRFEYHPGSAHWVLAELLERVSGEDFRTFVSRGLIGPLGLTRLRLGVPDDQQGDINDVELVGEPMSADEIEAVIGAPGIDLGEATEDDLLRFNSAGYRRVGIPGGGAVSTAADVALLYQAMLSNPGGLWDPEVLRAGTAEVLCDLSDPMTGVPAHRTLGLVSAGDDGHAAMRAFGSTTSGRAFGHTGAGGQLAWADPESGVSFCYLTNGLDAHFLRLGRRGVGLTNRAGALSDDVTQ